MKHKIILHHDHLLAISQRANCRSHFRQNWPNNFYLFQKVQTIFRYFSRLKFLGLSLLMTMSFKNQISLSTPSILHRLEKVHQLSESMEGPTSTPPHQSAVMFDGFQDDSHNFDTLVSLTAVRLTVVVFPAPSSTKSFLVNQLPPRHLARGAPNSL